MELKLDTNKEYGLVLEGGGAKGAYQIGAWKALKEAGIHVKGIAGTSVGALNGALIAMDDFEKAERIWETIHYSRVSYFFLINHFFNEAAQGCNIKASVL